MATTKADLEKENAELWETLEGIYDQLREVFRDEDSDSDEEEAEESEDEG